MMHEDKVWDAEISHIISSTWVLQNKSEAAEAENRRGDFWTVSTFFVVDKIVEIQHHICSVSRSCSCNHGCICSLFLKMSLRRRWSSFWNLEDRLSDSIAVSVQQSFPLLCWIQQKKSSMFGGELSVCARQRLAAFTPLCGSWMILKWLFMYSRDGKIVLLYY